MLKTFGFSVFATIASIVGAGVAGGFGAALACLVLIGIEVAFSVDNAVINAKVLERLSRAWQQAFLTIGMVVAILGMRFVFPILIVMITAGLSWGTVLDEALHRPHDYAHHLEAAHVSIAAFGGGFLLTLALYFLFDDKRRVLWIERLERRLQGFGSMVWLPPLLAAIVICIAATFMDHEAGAALRAGLIGAGSYAAMKLLIDALGRLSPKGQEVYTGTPALLAFLYLQLLDAAFSFDSVLGAFAITDKVLLIVLGLSVGAFWVRSLTVHMVRKGTLNEYIYLEHGAHYAILVLAVALLVSLFWEVPDAVTGLAGLGVIGASLQASREARAASKTAP